MEKKKIMFVVEAMGGGLFTYVVGLANELTNYCKVIVAYSERPETPRDFRQEFHKEVKLVKVENFTRRLNPIKDWKAVFELRRLVRELKPDVIHMHSSKAGVIGRCAFWFTKIPQYYTPHAYSFLMTNKMGLQRNFYKILETILAKGRCKTIACGKSEYHEARKLSKEAYCVSNGLVIEDMQQALKNIPYQKRQFSWGGGRTICVHGRICAQKDPELFNHIAEQFPQCQFVWVGDGEMRDSLTSPNIEITGWLSHAEGLEKLAEADMFLSCSKWEGLPYALLEAMYLKKVCVVSDAPGNCDLVSRGETGYLCRSEEEYIAAIKSILDNTQEEKEHNCKMVQQAFDNIMKKYNMNNMAKQYYIIYSRGWKQS